MEQMQNIAVGAHVWVPSGQGWVAGVVASADGQLLQIDVPGSSALRVPVAEVRLQNPSGTDAEDMTALTHLHEPGVLHNLHVRFGADKIYTLTGSILIAVNPFKAIPALLAPGVMRAYAAEVGTPTGEPRALSPHVYGVAVNAYRQMLRDGAGQAILITGESGAGKTETCKLIMRCLAQLGSREYRGEGSRLEHPGPATGAAGHAPSDVERLVLQSNPILEAFGNAKTSRNDNSSRFGKYVEIRFDEAGLLEGGAIHTYLLERSRVVHLAAGERCFHAFYQLCAGASEAERRAWHLEESTSYVVLRQSSCNSIPGLDDAAEYQVTRDAMGSMGLDADVQARVFRLLAALLHLGNVAWAEVGKAGGAPAPPPGVWPTDPATSPACCEGAPLPADAASWQALAWAAELLGVPAPGLLAACSTRTRSTPDGPITSPLTPAGADESRNAMCKVLYARLFAWLVARINERLSTRSPAPRPAPLDAGSLPAGPATPGPHRAHSSSALAAMAAGGGEAKAALRHTVGLLDIYGFESFETNDLEQLCINLANEKLQQHFNQHVFKWEQAEYVREGIDWRHISFVDNQEVLDLLEGRLGLLDLLDEQCRFPTATGADLAHKFSAAPSVAASPRFEKLRRPPTAFAIQHYAGPVTYLTDNFLDKNKDYVVAEHQSLLGASGCSLVAALFAPDTPTHLVATPGPQASRANSSSGATPPATANGNSSWRGGSGGSTPVAPGTTTPPLAKSAFKFDSVTAQFKRQLSDLMATLHAMQPHYVRCIKPSPQNRPGVFEPTYVLHQLRCGGVLEAVRISCAGFAFKQPYAAALAWLHPLRPTELHTLRAAHAPGMHRVRSDGQLLSPAAAGNADKAGGEQAWPREAAVAALERVLVAAGVTDYHLGATKLFLKSQQAASLERQRGLAVARASTRIQAAWRGHTASARYAALRAAAAILQAAARGLAARRLAERLRREHAALVLQCSWRRVVAQHTARRRAEAILVLQAAWRARAARLEAARIRRVMAATLLQAAIRARPPRLALAEELARNRGAVCLQAMCRARAAQAEYAYLLPRHRAATRIQRAWRGSRRGARLRELLRWAALRVVAVTRAAGVLQRAWRTRSAQLLAAQLRRVQQRERFKAQLARFETHAAAAPVVMGPAPPVTKPRALVSVPRAGAPTSSAPSSGGDAGAAEAQNGGDVQPARDAMDGGAEAGAVDRTVLLASRLNQEISEVKQAARTARSFWRAQEQQRRQNVAAAGDVSVPAPPGTIKASRSSQSLSAMGDGPPASSPLSDRSFGELLDGTH